MYAEMATRRGSCVSNVRKDHQLSLTNSTHSIKAIEVPFVGVQVPRIAVLELGDSEARTHQESNACETDREVENAPFSHRSQVHDFPPHEAGLFWCCSRSGPFLRE